MAVGGCSVHTGGWSIRPYTVSANACHLRGILSGLTMLGDVQDVYLATFAMSIGGVKAAPSGGRWAGLVRTQCRCGAQSVALAISSAMAVRAAGSSALAVFSVLAASSALTECRLMGAAEAAVDDADGVVGEQGVGSADVGQVQMHPSASSTVGSATSVRPESPSRAWTVGCSPYARTLTPPYTKGFLDAVPATALTATPAPATCTSATRKPSRFTKAPNRLWASPAATRHETGK
jgi:hypothetical protein